MTLWELYTKATRVVGYSVKLKMFKTSSEILFNCD